jgi:GDP-4-dehydro-6-deoxy-D-mannose reductase
MILITGAGGFAGQYLIRELLKNGRTGQIWGLDFHYPPGLIQHPSVRYHEADITDYHDLANLLDRLKPDQVYHLAGFSSGAKAQINPLAAYRVNVIGTLHLLEAIRQSVPAAKILVITSAEVYGAGDTPGKKTETSPLLPLGPYAASKACVDIACRQYFTTYGLKVVVARPGPHTGPGQPAVFALPSFARKIAQIKAGGLPPVLTVGNLSVKRDFLDVRDVVRAYRLLMRKGKPGEAYNVSSGKAVQLSSLVKFLITLSGIKITVQQDPQLLRKADLALLRADNRKLKRATGWKPRYIIRETLKNLLQFETDSTNS